ncbi:hypothetical protein [Marinitoga lauensis]|uniref:hypothetical protein n=1 Tax=Marinitoga lauensis TaxID=2201189 RepID=UPI001012452A|nr:hypothetical protein [Marinitoga lauensis]
MKSKKFIIIFLLVTIILLLNGCLTKENKIVNNLKTDTATIDLSKYIKTEKNENGMVVKTQSEINGIEFEFEKNINEGNFKFSNNTLHLFYEKDGKKRLMIAKKGKKGFESNEILYAYNNTNFSSFKVIDIDKEEITRVAEGKIQSGVSIMDNIMNKDGYDEIIIHAKDVNNIKTLYLEIGFNKDVFEIDIDRGIMV